MTRRSRGRVAALVLLTALAGCTGTVRGSASPADDATPTAAPSTSAPSTTGPSEPPIEITPPPARGVGLLLEAHRIASVTALVQTSFPDRTDTCFPSGPSTSAQGLESVYFTAGTAAPILEDYGFVTAWGQCNRTVDGEFATITLAMELSDPQAAVRLHCPHAVTKP